MDNEKITLNEMKNDGGMVHLYYDRFVGFWVAYGYSGFLATHVIDGVISFSDELQMPLVLIGREDKRVLEENMESVEKSTGGYICLRMERPLRMDGYAKWAAVARKNR
ncbi:MAG: hypothetical protein IK143_00380 [Bacteroidales bacterium]|nr:hypothetical protein [Bacteroidales bacterium]